MKPYGQNVVATQSLQMLPLILKPVLSFDLRLIKENGIIQRQQHSPVLVNNFES